MPAASRSSATASRRPARSTYARPGPFTITSVTAASARSGSSGPKPATSSVSSPSEALEAHRRAGAALRRGAARRGAPAPPSGSPEPSSSARLGERSRRACTRCLGRCSRGLATALAEQPDRASRRAPGAQADRGGAPRGRRRRRHARSAVAPDTREHGAVEHIARHLGGAERAARLFDEHDTGRARASSGMCTARRRPGSSPRRTTTERSATSTSARVAGARQCPRRRSSVRGRRAARRQSRTRLGRGQRRERRSTEPRGRSATPGAAVDRESLERVGRRLGTGREPVGESGPGIGGRAKIAGWSPARSARRAPSARRARNECARGGEDGRAGTALRGPQGDEHSFPSSDDREEPGSGRGRRGKKTRHSVRATRRR